MSDQYSSFSTKNDKRLKMVDLFNYLYHKEVTPEIVFAAWNYGDWQDVGRDPELTIEPQTSLTEELVGKLFDPAKLLDYITGIHWELSEIKSELNLLRNQMRSFTEIEEVVEIRTIPDQQAKEEIVKLFSETSDILYYGDIAEKLRLDLRQVVKIAKELEDEGYLVDADAEEEET